MRSLLRYGLSGLSLLLASDVVAAPAIQDIRLFYAEDGIRTWQLLADDTDPDVYYQLPQAFVITPPPGLTHGAHAVRDADGNLILRFSWGTPNWSIDDAAMRSAIARDTGRQGRIRIVTAKVTAVDLDPELTEGYGARFFHIGGVVGSLLPSSLAMAELHVPAIHAEAFRRRVVSGAGFSNLVTMQLRLPSVVAGDSAAAFPYSTNFFIGGLDYCETAPEAACF